MRLCIIRGEERIDKCRDQKSSTEARFEYAFYFHKEIVSPVFRPENWRRMSIWKLLC